MSLMVEGEANFHKLSFDLHTHTHHWHTYTEYIYMQCMCVRVHLCAFMRARARSCAHARVCDFKNMEFHRPLLCLFFVFMLLQEMSYSLSNSPGSPEVFSQAEAE